MIDKDKAPQPPDGYELVWEGKYIEGDLYWMPQSQQWRLAKFRIGHSIDMYKTPPARRKLIGVEATQADLNHLFGIKTNDKPQTTEGDHW